MRAHDADQWKFLVLHVELNALRQAASNMPVARPGQPYEHAAGWLRARADAFEEADRG